MHPVNHREKIFLALVLYIGIFSSVLNADVVEPDLETLEKNKTVFVEPSFVEVTKTKGLVDYQLKSYKDRRHNWGFLIGGGYSTYEPVNYEPNFAKTEYKNVYGRPALGMIEGNFSAKRNLSSFSLGLEGSVGTLKNENSDETYVGSVLSLTEIRVGAVLYLDRIYEEPTIVPYLSGGAYTMIFKETLGGNGYGGNAQISPYVNGGLAFSLDWIDRRAARIAYEESEIQSSYIYAEARKYFASSNKKDSDFSNVVSFAGGIRVEF
ncbi:MAG: hypothetical protein ACXVA9_04375 [Bdellovibrionales bacterium]